MSGNQPTTGREVIPAGIDVRKIRKPINDAFAAMPTEIVSEGAATSRDGRRMSFSVIGEDIFYIRLTDRTHGGGGAPHKYSWVAVVQDRDNGTWENSPRTGNTTDDWATELNNQNILPNTGDRFPARRNPQSGRVTFYQGKGGGGGNFTANSSETVLMILGDYETYKDCPNVPPKPPTTYVNFPCNETRSNTLCVPAYAYAVYQRCGYIWNKIGDTRTYQVWANEMNGQSFSSWRRFVIPRWGGTANETGLPNPDDDCIGVAFLGTGTGSALTCSCPDCLSTKCIKIRWTVPPDPGSVNECGSSKTDFDNAGAWGQTYEVEINTPCSGTAFSTDGLFEVETTYYDGSSFGCDWGPNVFDPCDPCEHWGRLEVKIYIAGGGANENCGGAGHWRGEFKVRELCEMLCDCSGPVGPLEYTLCDGCGNNIPPVFYFVDGGSVEIDCCDAP